jgi:endonuclease/exonuclease/phosphatase family metal-dependent hydrolase
VKSLLAVASILLATVASAAPPEEGTIRLATWNIENWKDHFQDFRDRELPEPATDDGRERRRQERFQNAEDNWEIAQVLLDPDFAPHVLVFQEGCSQAELDYFAEEWEAVGEAFPTRIVFPGNSGRGQTLGLMLAPGFKVIEQSTDHYLIPDEQDLNPRSDRLFGRGPAFALIESPDGDRFWVGTTHQKSKGGNSVEVTKWRGLEAATTHQIMLDLAKRGDEPVYLLGDMNDEIGIQTYELDGGGDVMMRQIGALDDDPTNDLVNVTADLAMSGVITYTGYWRGTFRSFIDHIIVTPDAVEDVVIVGVHDDAWARVASDHLPVYVDIKP